MAESESGPTLHLRAVTVAVTSGFGVLAAGVDALAIDDLTVDGPIATQEMASALAEWDGAETVIGGLVVIGEDCGDVPECEPANLTLHDVTVGGVAGLGVALIRSSATWTQGEISRFVGVGLTLESCSDCVVRDVAVHDGLRGAEELPESIGVWLKLKTEADLEQLAVSEVEGVGIVQEGARATFRELILADNASAGVWVRAWEEDGPDSPTSIEGAVLRNNAGFGIGVQPFGDIEPVVLRRMFIGDTRWGSIDDLPIDGADGIRLLHSNFSASASVHIENSVLSGNGRTAIFLRGRHELTADPAPSEGEGVHVCGANRVSEEWDCSIVEDEPGEWRCVRSEPWFLSLVWLCADEGGATRCSPAPATPGRSRTHLHIRRLVDRGATLGGVLGRRHHDS